MTKHKIDDLFEQKLAGSEFTPSAAAWSKLESQLAQKKKKGAFFYLSIAASFALLLTFGWLAWRAPQTATIALNDPAYNSGIAAIDSAKMQAPTIDAEKEVTEPIEEAPKKAVDKQVPVKKYTPKSKDTKKPVKRDNTPVMMIQQKSNLAQLNVVEEKANDGSQEIIDHSLIIEELSQNIEESTALNIPEKDAEQSPKESRSIKLIYTLKPAISAERIAEQAQEEESKTSPFKKAMAFAKNMKENPKGLGDLRDVKNNLLSFNKKESDSK